MYFRDSKHHVVCLSRVAKEDEYLSMLHAARAEGVKHKTQSIGHMAQDAKQSRYTLPKTMDISIISP